MARRVYRLTESSMRNIINRAVRRINEEDNNGRSWTDAYDEWSDSCGDKEKGEKLSDEWHERLKKEYPNKKDRRRAIHKHCKERDVKNGKTGGKWDNYDKEMSESIRRNVRRTIMEHMFDQPWNETDLDGSRPRSDKEVYRPNELGKGRIRKDDRVEIPFDDTIDGLLSDNDPYDSTDYFNRDNRKKDDYIITANDYEGLNLDDFYPD